MEFKPGNPSDGSSSPHGVRPTPCYLEDLPQERIITGFVATQRVSKTIQALVFSGTYKWQWRQEYFKELGIQIQFPNGSDKGRSAK